MVNDVEMDYSDSLAGRKPRYQGSWPKAKGLIKIKGGTHLRANVRASKRRRPSGMKMRHARDPAEETFEKLGDLSGFNVLNNYVLYAIYERPLVTASGIHITQSAAAEDEYQGKAGLIVAVGPMVNDEHEIRGFKLERGNWIAVRPSDGWAIKVNGVLCRMINEKSIHMVVPSPDSVF
jgi:co-chaperonin GroES (HSP10)